jgi:type I restriction enzyme S subunit
MKPGYKQTEIGIIPEDWEVVSVSRYGDVVGGGTPSTAYSDYWNGTIAWCTPTDITGTKGRTIAHTSRYITELGLNNSAAVLLPAGTVLLCTRATIGEARITTIPITTNQGFKNIVLKDGSALFLYYLLQTKKKEMLEKAIGSTFLELSKKELCSIPVQFPSKPEQDQIAEALSDIDDLISDLEKLIEKKKAIKQGAMQQLLTGKTRLPGFSGKWKQFNLLKNSRIKARIGWQGLKKSEYLKDGYAILITGTDFENGRICWERCHYVDKGRYDLDTNIQVCNDDILITKDGSLGKAAIVTELSKPATLNSGIFLVRPIKESYDPYFVYDILTSFVFLDFLEKLSAGSTIVHLYQKDIDKFEFMIPPTKEEQTAIAEVLSDMDNDIKRLENKLDKMKHLKQGMMQQLLTGQIRLTERDE